MYIITNITIFIIFLLVSYFFLIKSNKIFYKLKLLDYPNERKIHSKPVPLAGGALIYIVFFLYHLSEFILFKNFHNLTFFIFCSLCFFLGIVDDIKNIKPYIKLTAIFLFYLLILKFDDQYLLNKIYLPSINKTYTLNYLSVFVTGLCILLLINAINLSDGINGLIISLTITWLIILYLLFGYQINILLIVCLFFLLILNYREKLFLGDSGSLFIGSYISLMTIKGYNSNLFDYTKVIPVEIVIILFLLPGIDMFRLFCERSLKNLSPFSSDRNHLHHYLISRFSLPQTLVFYNLTIVFFYVISKSLLINNFLLIFIFLLMYFSLLIFLKKTK